MSSTRELIYSEEELLELVAHDLEFICLYSGLLTNMEPDCLS